MDEQYFESQQQNCDQPTTPPLTQSIDVPKRKIAPLFIALFFVAFIGIGYLAYNYYELKNEFSEIQNSPAIAENEPKTSQVTNTSNTNDLTAEEGSAKPQLVFLKDPGRDSTNKLEAWSVDVDGSNLTKLLLNNFQYLFKYPRSNKIYFLESQTDNIFSILDLPTNNITRHTLITHPQENVDEGVTISSIDYIAPDGSGLIFETFFTEPCPEISPPPGSEGGFGPCIPEEVENFPSGYYVYNVNKQSSRFIGSTIQFSRWDLENDEVYFIIKEFHKEGLYKYNLSNNQIGLVKKGNSFGYAAFPLFKSDRIIEFDGTTGTEGRSHTQVGVLDKQTGNLRIIDTGKWAEIQPFASISPDESSFIYMKTQSIGDGYVTSVLYLVDLNTLEILQLTPFSEKDSYTIRGTWLDNQNFVTSVDTIEKDNYYNGNNYLVKINTNTQKITRLTPQNNVYRFNID